jgi:hypothetical protein
MLFALLLLASQPQWCWYSDGWHGSGHYDCDLGPWVKEYDQLHVPTSRLQT